MQRQTDADGPHSGPGVFSVSLGTVERAQKQLSETSTALELFSPSSALYSVSRCTSKSSFQWT